MTDKIRVASADEFESGESREIELGETKIALVRMGDDFYALGDRCSHANYSLSEGEVDCDRRTLTCWKHGAEFSVVDGVPQTLPATQPVPVYAVDVACGEVFVSLPGDATQGRQHTGSTASATMGEPS